LEGESESSINSKYKAIVTKLKLEDQAKINSKHISGGEKQKVAVARAMIHNPEFIIADEPTGNLDWGYTQEIGDLLVEANKGGNSIILITHDIHLLNYIKSKVNVNIFQM